MAKSTTPAPAQTAEWQSPAGMPSEDRIIHGLENYSHFNEKCQSLAETFEELGKQIRDQVPMHPARVEALRKLLQARDYAIQALV